MAFCSCGRVQKCVVLTQPAKSINNVNSILACLCVFIILKHLVFHLCSDTSRFLQKDNLGRKQPDEPYQAMLYKLIYQSLQINGIKIA